MVLHEDQKTFTRSKCKVTTGVGQDSGVDKEEGLGFKPTSK